MNYEAIESAKPAWVIVERFEQEAPFLLPQLDKSFSVQVLDSDSKETEKAIAQVLEIQKSLLLPLTISEMPAFAQTGFLTIQWTHDSLKDFLRTGNLLIASHQGQIIGYLLLDQIDGYLSWARRQRFESEWNLEWFCVKETRYIDQIGVLSAFARQGIGKALVDYAKMISPKGLLTDILFAPYANQASVKFFESQGFVQLGSMHIGATSDRSEHVTSVMFWPYD